MAILATKVPIGVTPTLIVPADPDGAYIHLRVAGSAPVYLGGDDVSVDQGFEIENEDGIMSMNLSPQEPLYGILEEAARVSILVLATAYG